MGNDKDDFDYEAFMEFMNSFTNDPQYQFVFVNSDDIFKMNADANTHEILRQMDELEADVATRPCYNSVEDMLEAIKGM